MRVERVQTACHHHLRLASLHPSTTMSQPCAFFLRNACSYGDTCRNSHAALTGAALRATGVDPVSPACGFFLRGRCRFGDECREYHPPSDSSRSVQVTAKPPCRFFSRGSCMKGNECPYSHETQVDLISVPKAPIPETKRPQAKSTGDVKTSPIQSWRSQLNTKAESEARGPIVAIALKQMDDDLESQEVHSSADRVTYNCNVQFGTGALVLQVVTPFESQRVLISNIPASTSDTAISLALARFTESAELQIHRPTYASLPTVTLRFADSAAAAQAVASVSEVSIEGNILRGQLDLRVSAAAEEGKGVLRGRKVKLTWYGRRASAFVHYPTVQSAEKHCQRLDGASYRGYILSASFRRPTPAPVPTYRRRTVVHSTQVYTVMIRNLPLDVSNINLQRFCQAEGVAIDLPRCPADAPDQMRRVLEGFGPVDTFDTLPMSKSTAKLVAFAQFQTANAAAAAESALRTTSPPFLGRTPFFIERTFSVKYSIRPALFGKVRGPIDLLAGLHPSMIRYYLDENSADPVIIVLHGSDPKTLGRVKAELDRVVQGELLVLDGQKFWDDFFDGVEGQTFVDSLNTTGNVFIRSDTRTRTIRLFGPEAERLQARNLTLEKLVEVRARRHVFPLRKDLIRLLLRGKMRQIQENIGTDRLVLDVVARTLTVTGDENHLRRLRAELSVLESGGSLPADNNDNDRGDTLETICPVCFCDVEDAVRLNCGHTYCRDCLQHYLRQAPQDSGFSPRKCVAEVLSPGNTTPASVPCGLGIPYPIIRSLLTSAEEDFLLHASFLAHINEHPAEFRYCPSPDCEMVYRSSVISSTPDSGFQCPSCLIHICPACNVEYHDGITCAEHQDNLTGGLAALARWREENGVKQCPNCHADIEKNGGCNHMQCALCRTHICWVCLKTFSDRGDNGGIYPHMQREHGGMGI
ncbi:hypothetical protein C8F04DRAFT_1014251 [Mycena alexandri]|uniref:RBR-type E3 ubiquitin transferase n=1 Tax=Mycena alexandri TaxID=1745969 RepID=A0AAD6S421_9AGAR|nr:hypothetical protein C8F04DRAFT_1014251 [Mycena alexandri]